MDTGLLDDRITAVPSTLTVKALLAGLEVVSRVLLNSRVSIAPLISADCSTGPLYSSSLMVSVALAAWNLASSSNPTLKVTLSGPSSSMSSTMVMVAVPPRSISTGR